MIGNKSFNTPHQVLFIKNILISNIRSFSKVLKHVLPPDSTIIKQRIPHNLCVFSTRQDVCWIMKSFRWRQMYHGRELLKKKQTMLRGFNILLRGLSKRHYIIEKDFWGPRLPLLEEKIVAKMIIIGCYPTCWTSG